MPGLNDAAMTVAATALQGALLYGQLHSGPAGTGTTNVTTAARKSLSWGAITGAGDFSLDAQVDFTGGEPNGPVYSLTLWSASTSGTCYGEFIISGDAAFNGSGQYSLTSLDLDGTAS